MLKPPDQDHDIGDKIIRAFSQSIKLNPNTKKLKEEHLDSHMSLNLTPEESEKRDIMLKPPDQDLDAKRESDVLEIELQKQLLKKEREKEVNDLEIEIIKSREENQADVDAYKKEKEAEANKNLYSPDYVKLEMAKALSDNTKFYFSGETSPLGALLNKILGDS